MSQLIENALHMDANGVINIRCKVNYYPKKSGEERIRIWATAIKTIND